jgi:adenosylcobinamide-phosphate synthase
MQALLFLGAGALDEVVGDPEGWPHPVRAMGWCIAKADAARKQVRSPHLLRCLGILLALSLPAAAAAFAWSCQRYLGWSAVLVLGAWMLAGNSLRRAVRRVLKAADLDAARSAVGGLVGRDVEALDAEGVYRASLESLGESLCDGVVAPLFWFTLAGLPGLWAFKAVSTLDSMVGHREAPWTHFGWASARLDDLANWIPARLTALLIAAASLSWRAWATAWREASAHASPNAGWGEAALAGALGVELGGVNVYDGVPKEGPRFGKAMRPLEDGVVREGLVLAARVNRWALLLGALALWRCHG